MAKPSRLPEKKRAKPDLGKSKERARPFIRSPYDGSRVKVGLACGPVVTKQSFKDECDITRIVNQYARTGTVEHLNRREPRYMDVSEVPDYRSALEQVKVAEEAFMSLPAKVRARFANDPAEFLDFATNPDNRSEMVELGLLSESEVTETGSKEAPEAAIADAVGQTSEASASVEVTADEAG